MNINRINKIIRNVRNLNMYPEMHEFYNDVLSLEFNLKHLVRQHYDNFNSPFLKLDLKPEWLTSEEITEDEICKYLTQLK